MQWCIVCGCVRGDVLGNAICSRNRGREKTKPRPSHADHPHVDSGGVCEQRFNEKKEARYEVRTSSYDGVRIVARL